MRIAAVLRALLVVVLVALVGGCGGSGETTRVLEGGTLEEELGLTLVVDDVEVGADETRAPVTIRNASAHKLVFDPFGSVLVVDGERHVLERSEFPTLIPDVGSGGGETSGVLVFPAVAVDATSYELQLEGTSENTVVGDDGNVEWNVVLQPADTEE